MSAILAVNMKPFRPEKVPVDILLPILEQLDDRRDLWATALASHKFNEAATPVSLAMLCTYHFYKYVALMIIKLLYRRLDAIRMNVSG